MHTATQDLAPPMPPAEWRRSGPFVVISVLVHLALLLSPIKIHIGKVDIPPTSTIVATLVEAVSPPKPMPVQPVSAPAPQQAAHPRERPVPTPRPVLAVPAEPARELPGFSVPVPVIAPAAPAAPNAPPASAQVASAPATISAARYDAAYLHNPRPTYPPMSRRLGEEGKVLLKVRVSSDGRALAVDLEKSSNFPRLDDAALDVVKRWRFVPAKRGDEAIEASVIVPLVFRLEE